MANVHGMYDAAKQDDMARQAEEAKRANEAKQAKSEKDERTAKVAELAKKTYNDSDEFAAAVKTEYGKFLSLMMGNKQKVDELKTERDKLITEYTSKLKLQSDKPEAPETPAKPAPKPQPAPVVQPQIAPGPATGVPGGGVPKVVRPTSLPGAIIPPSQPSIAQTFQAKQKEEDERKKREEEDRKAAEEAKREQETKESVATGAKAISEKESEKIKARQQLINERQQQLTAQQEEIDRQLEKQQEQIQQIAEQQKDFENIKKPRDKLKLIKDQEEQIAEQKKKLQDQQDLIEKQQKLIAEQKQARGEKDLQKLKQRLDAQQRQIDRQRKQLKLSEEARKKAEDDAKAQQPKTLLDILRQHLLATFITGGGGTGILGTGGLLLGILLPEDEDNLLYPPPPPPGPTPAEEPDPLYDEPPTNDDDYNKKLYSVANMFASIKEKFKEAIKNGKYESNTFEISLGPVSIGNKPEPVSIKYTFEKGGAGSIDTSLNAVGVEVFPNQIDGYAVTQSGILDQIGNEESKTFTSILFKPTSGIIFLIKMGLLLNPDPSFKDDIVFANHVLLESVLLLCRLKWDPNYKDLAVTSSLFAEFPTWVWDEFGNSKKEIQGKMFSEMVNIYSEPPAQSSALTEAVSSTREVSDYKSKVQATVDLVNPLITNKLSYSDKVLLVHAISRLVYDLGTMLPKAPADQKKELAARLKLLAPALTDFLDLMTDAKFEPKFIAEVKKCLSDVTNLKAGKKVTLSKPLSGDPIVDVKNYSLGTIITTCIRHYTVLSTRKFKGDDGYLTNDFFLGRGETEDAMLAIWIRCLHDADKAKKLLLETKNPVVELRTFGVPSPINPANIISELITSKNNELEKSLQDLAAAKENLKANRDSSIAKKHYRVSKEKVASDIQKIIDAARTFIRQYAVYYPLKRDDDSTLTAAELAQREFANVKKLGSGDEKLFDQLADIFEQIIGLPRDRIW